MRFSCAASICKVRCLGFEDAVALVAKRGAYMEEEAPAGSGKITFLNTPVRSIEEACQKAPNLEWLPQPTIIPQQIVIGGEVVAVDRAVEPCRKLVPNA